MIKLMLMTCDENGERQEWNTIFPATLYIGKSQKTADMVRQAIISAATLAGAQVHTGGSGSFLPNGEPKRHLLIVESES